VTEIDYGELAPSRSYQGTVYFKEVSQLATEVEGRVLEVLFEEGDHIAAGSLLLRLDGEILSKSLASARASVRQRQTQFNQEEVRLERARLLLADEVTTPQEFDDIRFNLEALEHSIAVAQAEVERLSLELARKEIRAPFDGVVVERLTEEGEWKSTGATVAVFARDHVYDVVANVPEAYIGWINAGDEALITINDELIDGEIVGVMPRGDVVSRTFPVRVRISGEYNLREGMSATVQLPSGQVREAILAPRDAVLLREGQQVLFTVADGQARLHEVEVLGYAENRIGVASPSLDVGMPVIVRGHERLRPGQEVRVAE